VQLQPGTQLGAYRIVAGLGSGGMGEVYRARQDGLDRDVAIKLLPARLRSDPAALQRFEREAKVLAGLSHPNIVAIYDFVRLPGNSQHRRSESGDALERDAPEPLDPNPQATLRARWPSPSPNCSTAARCARGSTRACRPRARRSTGPPRPRAAWPRRTSGAWSTAT
jgi:serine/threonine protein kinase